MLLADLVWWNFADFPMGSIEPPNFDQAWPIVQYCDVLARAASCHAFPSFTRTGTAQFYQIILGKSCGFIEKILHILHEEYIDEGKLSQHFCELKYTVLSQLQMIEKQGRFVQILKIQGIFVCAASDRIRALFYLEFIYTAQALRKIYGQPLCYYDTRTDNAWIM